jgi:hypothetical protein
VGADHGGVQDQPLQVGIAQDGHHPRPDALGRPAVEAPPLAIPVAEPLGKITPRGARAGHPKDGIEESSVVFGDTAVLARLAGEQVLDTVPIGIRNLVATTHNRSSVTDTKDRGLPELPTCCPHDLGDRAA